MSQSASHALLLILLGMSSSCDCHGAPLTVVWRTLFPSGLLEDIRALHRAVRNSTTRTSTQDALNLPPSLRFPDKTANIHRKTKKNDPRERRDVIAVGNEAGDFFLMAIRTPSQAAGTEHGDNPRLQQPPLGAAADRSRAALGFSWDVLARKRIVAGGAAGQKNSSSGSSIHSSSSTIINNNNGSSSRGSISSSSSSSSTYGSNRIKNNSNGAGGSPKRPGSSFDDGGASNVPVPAPATVGSGGGRALGGRGVGAARGRSPRAGADDRRRRSKRPTKRSEAGQEGEENGVSLNRKGHPVGGENMAVSGCGGGSGGGGGGGKRHSLSPPRTSRKDRKEFPSPNERRPQAAPAAKAMLNVSVLRFSPNGRVLAAACGISIHLYREAAAIAIGNGHGSHSSGREAYRRYAVCRGHGGKVRSFDFSRDGSVLQSNDASGELLFWDVSTGKQARNPRSLGWSSAR